jgi:hypothetical protein
MIKNGDRIGCRISQNSSFLLGDRFVVYAALHECLHIFAEQNHLDVEVNLDEAGFDALSFLPQAFSVGNWLTNEIKNGKTLYQSWLLMWSTCFEIQVPEEIFHQPPKVFHFKDEANVFDTFSHESVRRLEQEFRSNVFDGIGRPVTAICVCGSNPMKRYTEHQQETLQSFFEKRGYAVLIISDEKIGQIDNGTLSVNGNKAVFYVANLNEVVALGHCSDKIILVDSLWDLILPGEAMLSDVQEEAKIITLFTCADERYHVPNTQIVEGTSVEVARRKNLFPIQFGLLSEPSYRKINGFAESEPTHLADSDFLALMRRLKQLVPSKDA